MLNHTLEKFLIASALTLASSTTAIYAYAASSGTATFTVKASIVPGACSVTLDNVSADTIDYGTLLQANVQNTYTTMGGGTAYDLGTKNMSLSVVCPASTTFALAFADNNTGKSLSLSDSLDAANYGLVDDSSDTVGGFRIALDSAPTIVSGTTPETFGAYVYHSTSSGGLGSNSAGGLQGYAVPGYMVGIIDSADSSNGQTTTPSSLSSVTMNLTVDTYVSKATVDSATNQLNVTGSGTVTLQYV